MPSQRAGSEVRLRPVSRWADICPWPELRVGRPVDRWNPWLLAWHAFVYMTLAAATVSTVRQAEGAGQARLVLILSMLLGARRRQRV
jgi:hypothetical protein